MFFYTATLKIVFLETYPASELVRVIFTVGFLAFKKMKFQSAKCCVIPWC